MCSVVGLKLRVLLSAEVLFSWHPSFMAIGFLGLMSEGILTSISFRNLEGNERLQKIWMHLSWQAAATACIIAGFWTIYENKVRKLLVDPKTLLL